MQSFIVTKLTAKSSWYFRLAVFVWYYRFSALSHNVLECSNIAVPRMF